MEISITLTKTIGFLLTGNIFIASDFSKDLTMDLNQTFEIRIFSGEVASATVTHIGRNVTKPIALELPKELKDVSYEKAYSLFLQNDLKLIVTDHGYEKLGNRKLLVEFRKGVTQCAVHVGLFIQGKYKGAEYRIKMDPNDLNLTEGEFQEENSREYKKAHVQLEEFKGLNEKVIKKILLKLKPTNFHVEVNFDTIIISLGPSLRQFIDKPHLSSPISRERIPPKNTPKNDKLFTALNFLDEEEHMPETDLADGHPEANHVFREMKRLFVNKHNPSEEYLKDLSGLIKQLYSCEGFRVFNTLINTLDEKSLLEKEILDVINETLQRFQITHFQREMKKVSGEEIHYSHSLLDTLDPKHYVKALALFTKSLNGTEVNENSLLLVYGQLKALIGLMLVMAIKGLTDIDKQVYKEAFDAMISFAHQDDVCNKYFMIDYASRYGKQVFSFVKEDSIDVNALIESSTPLFRGLSKIEDEICLKEPWRMVSKLFEKTDVIKARVKLESWRTGEYRWFVNLFAVRRMLLDPSPQIFLNFAEGIKNDFAKVQKEMDLQNAYFVFGFVELLGEVICFPEFEETNIEIRIKAQELLEMIDLNIENNDENLPFYMIQEKQRKVLKDTINSYDIRNNGDLIRSERFQSKIK